MTGRIAHDNLARGHRSLLSRCDLLADRIRRLVERSDDPRVRSHGSERLDRLKAARKALEERLSECVSRAKSKTLTEAFSVRPYAPTRALNFQERRADMERQNAHFNRIEGSLLASLRVAALDEASRVNDAVKRKLRAGDVAAALAATAFLIRGRIRDLVLGALRDAYNTGKNGAAAELGIKRSATPLSDTQVLNADAEDVAEAYVAGLESAARTVLKAGIQGGASAYDVSAAMKDAVDEAADKAAKAVAATVPGQYVNRGRMSVFGANDKEISSYERSEVLDDVTCEMCLSLDGRVVGRDDPFARMDIVHTHCRGVWMPIYAYDPRQPPVTGVPEELQSRFRLVGGVPRVNAFKQLKQAVPHSEGAKRIVAGRG